MRGLALIARSLARSRGRSVSIIVMNYGERENSVDASVDEREYMDLSCDWSRSISIQLLRSKARVEYNEYVNIQRGARSILSFVNSGMRVTGGVLSVSPGVVARHS